MSDPDSKKPKDPQDRTAGLKHHLKTLEDVARKLIPEESETPQSSSNTNGDADSLDEAAPSSPQPGQDSSPR